MDKHNLALISIIGITLDLLGGLYLAYDLLGGKHGPLRMLTRVVTYGLFFGIGIGATLGLAFGIAGGITTGATFGHEFERVAEGKPAPPWRYIALWCAIRGIGFGVGAAFAVGRPFGIWFGVLTAVGQILAYSIGFAPTTGLEINVRRQLLGALNRTVGYFLGGFLSGLVAGHVIQGLRFGLLTGLVIGILSLVVANIIPYIERRVDDLPARILGAVGACLVVLGFVLQSVQYWVTLLDAPVK